MKMVCNIFFFFSFFFFLGWRPRRSIVLCSWGGEEYGLLGSTEWVEVCKQVVNSKHFAARLTNSTTCSQLAC